MSFDEAITSVLSEAPGTAAKTERSIGYFSKTDSSPSGSDFGVAFRYKSRPIGDCPVFPVSVVSGSYVSGDPTIPAACTELVPLDAELLMLMLSDDWMTCLRTECEAAISKTTV